MQNIYSRITDRIIAELEAGTPPWVRPWSTDPDPLPRNALSQRHYRGINTLLLSMEYQERSYSSNQWLTFLQIKQLEGRIRKGERASSVVFFEMRHLQTESDTDDNPQGNSRTQAIPFMKVFKVFNLDQVEGLPATVSQVSAVRSDWSGDEAADLLIKQSGARILHRGSSAFYSPSVDQINLPDRSSFDDAGAYYSTSLHELCHWTGHSTRLDRKLGRRFGESAYAMEELIAELGAAYLCAHCRINGRLQHASYIDSWLAVLKSDKRAVIVAAAQAQKAADYVLERPNLQPHGIALESAA